MSWGSILQLSKEESVPTQASEIILENVNELPLFSENMYMMVLFIGIFKNYVGINLTANDIRFSLTYLGVLSVKMCLQNI